MKLKPIRIDGNVAYVPLTQGYEAVIDAADVHLVEGFNWHADTRSCTVYARRTVNGSSPSSIKMHRVIAGCDDDSIVDHADCNGLNNRRENLRVVGHLENSRNTRIRKNNSSGFKGVSQHKRSGKWQAAIWVNYKAVHLGEFKTPEAAHQAYSAASEKFHGEFGRAA